MASSLLLLSLLACSSATAPATDGPPSTPTDVPTVPPTDTGGLPWEDDPCVGLVAVNDWTYQLDRWEQQGRAPGGMVLSGSSSVRRWEHARRDLSPWGPIQRGLGGAWLSDLAVVTDRLVPTDAASVVVFAGTNDLAGGSSADQVVDRYRCFVQRVHERAGPIPVVFVGITPTPARWAGWSEAEAVNEAVQTLAQQHSLLSYADVPTPFLDLGEPPPSTLFVADQLHLSPQGYELWTQAIQDALAAIEMRDPPAPAAAPSAPFYVRVDLGPSNAEDGASAPAADGLGIHWNSWHPIDGDGQVLAGEVLRDLNTTTGQATGIGLVISGGFRVNGYANGGLTTPDGALLQTMALAEATGDFFYTGDADDPGGLSLFGLDPDALYTLRLFGSRSSADETRSTRYTVTGSSTATATLVTTGPGVGQGGGDGNDGTVVTLTGLRPDAFGELHLDVAIEQGAYAYLNLLELEQQAP